MVKFKKIKKTKKSKINVRRKFKRSKKIGGSSPNNLQKIKDIDEKISDLQDKIQKSEENIRNLKDHIEYLKGTREEIINPIQKPSNNINEDTVINKGDNNKK